VHNLFGAEGTVYFFSALESNDVNRFEIWGSWIWVKKIRVFKQIS